MDRLLVLACLIVLPNQIFAKQKIVYGEDDREEVTPRSFVWEFSRSIAGRIHQRGLEKTRNGYRLTKVGRLSDRGPRRLNLCPSERFANQPDAVDCTGFLVASNLLLTAGHCMVPRGRSVQNKETEDCKETKWLFDYNVKKYDFGRKEVKRSQVVGCKRVIKGVWKEKEDFALVELDRHLHDRTPLTLSRDKPRVADQLYVVGHPSGLPLKLAAFSKVISVERNYFTSYMDTFGGNSGSPVFNESHEVTGILVRGRADYVRGQENGLPCRRVNRCDDDGENCFGGRDDLKAEHVNFIPRVRL